MIILKRSFEIMTVTFDDALLAVKSQMAHVRESQLLFNTGMIILGL